MIVERLPVEVLLAPRRLLESDAGHDAAEHGERVRELGGLEEVDVLVVVGSYGFVHALEHREQVFFVELCLPVEQGEVLVEISRPGFVEGVVADDVGVGREGLGHHAPVLSEAVLDPLFVLVESFEGGTDLGRRVILGKYGFFAIVQVRPPLFVLPVAVLLHGLALPEHLEDVARDAHVAGVGHVDRVEGRDPLPAGVSGVEVLVRVDHGEDSLLPHLGDELVHLGQVGHVVLLGGHLDRLPHDAQSHKGDAPVYHILQILIAQRQVRIKMVLNWDVGMAFHDNVRSVKDPSSSEFVSIGARCRVHGK